MNETRIYKAIGIVVAALAGAAFFFRVWSVVLPFLIGLILAYLVTLADPAEE